MAKLNSENGFEKWEPKQSCVGLLVGLSICVQQVLREREMHDAILCIMQYYAWYNIMHDAILFMMQYYSLVRNIYACNQCYKYYKCYYYKIFVKKEIVVWILQKLIASVREDN